MTAVEIDNVQAELVRRVEQGSGDEIVQLCRNGHPIGLIRFIGSALSTPSPRPVGLAAGTFTVPPEFFDPLPAALEAAFNGEVE